MFNPPAPPAFGFALKGASKTVIQREQDGEPQQGASLPPVNRAPARLKADILAAPQPKADPLLALKGGIGFSLYGNNPIYCIGALKNVELAATLYPGWRCVFYCDEKVPKGLVNQLRSKGAEVRPPVPKIANRMFDRFCLLDDPQFDIVLIRDCDSRITAREVAAVRSWARSGKKWHVARDHPFHFMPMMGACFAARRGAVGNITSKIINLGFASNAYTRESEYGKDQDFLAWEVWPEAQKDCLQHDSCCRDKFPGSVPFPTGCRFGDYRFVGEIYDAQDRPHPLHWQMRVNWMTV